MGVESDGGAFAYEVVAGIFGTGEVGGRTTSQWTTSQDAKAKGEGRRVGGVVGNAARRGGGAGRLGRGVGSGSVRSLCQARVRREGVSETNRAGRITRGGDGIRGVLV